MVFYLSAPLVLAFVEAEFCTKPFVLLVHGKAPNLWAPETWKQRGLSLPGYVRNTGWFFVIENVEVKVVMGKFDQMSFLLWLSLSADLWLVSCPYPTDPPPWMCCSSGGAHTFQTGLHSVLVRERKTDRNSIWRWGRQIRGNKVILVMEHSISLAGSLAPPTWGLGHFVERNHYSLGMPVSFCCNFALFSTFWFTLSLPCSYPFL